MASTAARPPAQEHPQSPARTAGARLTGPQLLALQLVARGCSPDQIAAMRRGEVVEVLWDLQAALGALGAVTVREAVERATRLGLIT